jgi:hypothetical protein
VTWTIHELGPNEQWDALRAKQIDVGFWREPKHRRGRAEACQPAPGAVLPENVCVAVNHRHPLARRTASS